MFDDLTVEDWRVEGCDVGYVYAKGCGEEAAVGTGIEECWCLRVRLDEVFDRLGL